MEQFGLTKVVNCRFGVSITSFAIRNQFVLGTKTWVLAGH